MATINAIALNLLSEEAANETWRGAAERHPEISYRGRPDALREIARQRPLSEPRQVPAAAARASGLATRASTAC